MLTSSQPDELQSCKTSGFILEYGNSKFQLRSIYFCLLLINFRFYSILQNQNSLADFITYLQDIKAILLFKVHKYKIISGELQGGIF